MNEPEIGHWYRHLDKGEVFQVVGFDEASSTIEIQSLGGDLDEIDTDSWSTLPLAPTEPPEDSSGAMDDVEREDLDYVDTESAAANWTQPPAPLGIEAWDDTRNSTSDELAEQDEDMRSSTPVQKPE